MKGVNMVEMWKILPEKQIGDFQISHFELGEFYVKAFLLRDIFTGREEHKGLKPGKFVKLCRKGSIIMSDLPMEYQTNSKFIQKVHGDVLIAGLGLGLVLITIQDNPEVKTITIIEKHQEIIDLIFPHLPIEKQCKVVCEDIFNYIPKKKFNTIYFDIWNDVNYDIQEIEILRDKFIEYLDLSDSDCYMGFWREQDANYYSELGW